MAKSSSTAAASATNGFYLPFDPEATGANYAANTVSSDGYEDGKSATDLYDGNIDNGVFIGPKETIGSFDATLTTNIPCTSLEVYVLNLNQTSASGSITANGGTPKAITTETGWIECNPPASGTLTSLVLNRTASAISNNALRFSAIKVDGKILVDSQQHRCRRQRQR